MSAAARLAGFGLVLAVVFGLAAAAGRALGPFERSVDVHDEAPAAAPHAEEPAAGHAPAAPAGLALAEGDLRIVPGSTAFEAGVPRTFEFSVLQRDRPLGSYDLTHERRMHLVVVRRDLGVFLHLHPSQRDDGSWAATLRLPDAGAYRAFADFSTGGEKATLGVDLHVSGGEVAPPASPPSARAAVVDGYRVELLPSVRRAGKETSLRFAVTRDGENARLGRYLGARGHLVVLREGDLAYLHTHAEEEELEFETSFPTAGRYRAFLQFRAGGAVRTAPFAIEVGE